MINLGVVAWDDVRGDDKAEMIDGSTACAVADERGGATQLFMIV